MNMKYSDLKEKSDTLCYNFNQHLHHEAPPDIDDTDVSSIILLFGLNPSSAGKERNSETSECFLYYVPEDESIESAKKIVNKINNNHLAYPTYFKQNFDLFERVNLIWQDDRYLSKIQFREKIGNKHKEIISYLDKYNQKHFVRHQHYLVFTDLLFIKDKSQKNVCPILDKNTNIREEVFRFFNAQLEYYKPKLVVITNGYASDLISDYISGEKRHAQRKTQMSYRGIPIIFSSMVSGQRTLDRYNRERLKKEIKDTIAHL